MRHPTYAFQLFSHKVLRRISVLPLLTTWAASAVLSRRPRYRLVATAMTAGMTAVVAGTVWTATQGRSNRIASMLGYFGVVNVAALHALFNVVTGRRIVRWTPQRPDESGAGSERL